VSRRLLYVVLAAVLAAVGAAFVLPSAHAATTFVSRNGAAFDLNGQPFRYGGANNYYLHYKSNLMVDDVFADAQAMGLKVIRAWTFLECGGDKPGANGTTCDQQGTNVWMQRWSNAANGGAGGVVYNETQLTAIDRMIASAAAHGIKLILPFAGNWRDFGGMDQYVAWYGLQFHDQFYTDTRIQQDYKNWITKLVNRTNTVTGVAYKNDPTIFAWELANEPRCINAAFPTSGTCTADTLVNWATTMSAFIKSLDANHMVSVGDEGFHPGPPPGTSQQWPYNITDGVDHARLTAIPSIDFGTYHLYPQGWGQSPADTWGTQWINDHNAVGATVNKPEILEEFGTTDQSTRDATYTAWTNAVRTGGGDGWNVWILTGIQDDGQLYPDFDGFRVVLPSSTATVLTNAAAQINSGGDTQAPSVPGTITTSGLTSTSVTLSWGASTDNVGVTGYDIFRATGASGGTFASVGTSTTTSFTNTGLTANTTYRFQIRARDAAGNASAFNTAVPVTTPGGGTGGCSATIPVQSQWSGGYVVQAVTTNTRTSNISAWTVTFTLPAGQTITNSWNVSITISGTTVTAHNLSYNGTIAPNGTQGWGFQASRPSADTTVANTPACTPS
jgi:mannan endo-1,4-beta-mannosidase